MTTVTDKEELEAYQRWESALAEELRFWDGVMRTGGEWPEDVRERLNPESQLQDEVRALLSPPYSDALGSVLWILDVGAGPLTTLGKRWSGRTVVITAIDPLADHYMALHGKYGASPPVPTRRGEGENLTKDFARDTFDLAYSRNALDHARDPVKAIQGMLDVVKPGGWVLLDHAEREADRQGHAGLHQHNFYCAGCPVDTAVRELFVETAGKTTNVNHSLEGQDHAGIVSLEHGRVVAKFRKRRSP